VSRAGTESGDSTAPLDPPGTPDAPTTRALAAVRRRFARGESLGADPWDALRELLAQEAPLLSQLQLDRWTADLARDLVGLGPIERLLAEPGVTDVLVNGPGPVWIERFGRLERTTVRLDRTQILRTIERLVRPLGLQADRTHPVVDARLSDGSRIAAVLDPLAVDGPLLAVRRHRTVSVALDDMAGPFAPALRERVERRRNIVVYGPTGAGKTTLLNSLVSTTPPGERIVTIEDVAELQLPGDHVVRLEARPGTAEGVGRVAIRDLVRAALRLRPDRLVVGEVRGAEALDTVWALSTGHDGSMTTLHASSAEDALRRLATLSLTAGESLPLAAVDAQVRAAVHVLVGVRRSHDGARRVAAVHDVRDGRTVPWHPAGPDSARRRPGAPGEPATGGASQ